MSVIGGQSAAAGVLELLDFESLVLVLVLSALVSDLLSVLESVVSILPGESVEDAPFLRLSVTYQPLPLKTIAGAVSTRRDSAPHSVQVCTAGASKPSRFS
jgi:hypothetical protein